MHSVLVVGAGKIGSLISVLLANSNNYEVHLADINIDAKHIQQLKESTPHLNLVKLNAQDPDELAAFAPTSIDPDRIVTAKTVVDGLERAKSRASSNGLMLVTGSLYLVGEARRFLTAIEIDD